MLTGALWLIFTAAAARIDAAGGSSNCISVCMRDSVSVCSLHSVSKASMQRGLRAVTMLSCCVCQRYPMSIARSVELSNLAYRL